MSDAASSLPALPPPTGARPRNGHSSGPPVFLVALLIGVGLHLGVLILFHFKAGPSTTAASANAPYIHYNDVAHNPKLQTMVSEAQFSPEQPYLSTEMSFSTQALPRPATPTESDPKMRTTFPPQPTSSEVDFHQPLQITAANARPGDALKPSQWDVLNNFGQAPTPGGKLAARGAIVRITRQGGAGASNAAPVEIIWPPDLAPPAGNSSWQPVSFILRFNAAGLASEPVLEPGFAALLPGSAPNDPAVNTFLRAKLRDWFTVHPPLPQGQYEAVIGP